MRLALSVKLLLGFLAISLSSLAAFGYVALSGIRQLGTDAFQTSNYVGWSAVSDAAVAFESLNRRMVQLKTEDVAREIAVYLDNNPGRRASDLQSDRRLREIAIQSVSTTGFTSLLEAGSGTFLFHSQPELVNTTAGTLADKFPAAWKVLAPAINDCVPSSGNGSWQLTDGSLIQAYLDIVPVQPATADGKRLLVLSVVNMYDFSQPSIQTYPRIVNATLQATNSIEAQMQHTQRLFTAILAALVVAVVALSAYLAKRITGPITLLARGAETIGRGDFEHRVVLRTRDEIEDLAGSFNKMAADLKLHVNRLRDAAAEKAGFQREMEIARDIQQGFLPEVLPALQGIQLAASSVPAREIGGDFYDFIQLPEGRWGLVIADVSGKGIPAALFMAVSRTLLRASVVDTSDPSEAVARANNLICADATSSMFVTLFLGILDPTTRELTYVNAGHNPPLLLRSSRTEPNWLQRSGIALGVTPNSCFDKRTVDLAKGDVLLLYTDGVTESVDRAGDEFGAERLTEALCLSRHASPAEIISTIHEKLRQFVGQRPEFDDITMLALKIA